MREGSAPEVEHPARETIARFRTIVLSCGDLGIEVSNALSADATSEVVALVTAPYARRKLTLSAKFRHVIRRQGWLGVLKVFGAKLKRLIPFSQSNGQPADELRLAAGINHIHVEDFHSRACVEAMHQLRPDLAVVAGTYILNESVFSIPRLGSINLHSGKVPEYRGSAPAFWELYHGESVVGVTVHRVVRSLDAGPVLAQETFPIQLAPDDPLEYIERFKRGVLRPNGVRMLVETVRALAQGTVKEMPQDDRAARTFPSPDHRAVRELRRKVRTRKRGAS